LVNNVELFSDAKASKALAPRAREDSLKKAKAGYDENPTSLDAISIYADALFNNHKFEETEKLLEQACSLGDNLDIIYNLAFVCSVNGKEDRAKDLYRKVIALAPGTALAKSAEYELWKMGEKVEAKWLRR
jgi:tetratricopeptide (TPR) repeat protein